jgi:hypothetical protein
VFATVVNDVAEQQQGVEDGYELIRNTPIIFSACDNPKMRQTARYVEAQGQYFEHFCNLLLKQICDIGITVCK